MHTAKLIRSCGLGGVPGSAGVAVVLEDGRRVHFDELGQPNRIGVKVTDDEGRTATREKTVVADWPSW